MAKQGRPRRDADEMLQKLEPFLKVGMTLNEAAMEAGIATSTAHKKYSEDKYFMEQVDIYKNHCIALAESKSYNLIKEGDPQHVRWFLERRKREKYATRVESKVEAQVDNTYKLDEESKGKLDELATRFK